MKTIEISDRIYDTLSSVSQRCGCASVATYIEQLPELQNEQRKQEERRALQWLEKQSFWSYALWEKFLISVCLVQKINPLGFEKLEGLTKPTGQAIFISRNETKIRSTSDSAKPVAIGDTGFFLNVHGGQNDFEHLIDIICRKLSLSPSIPIMLKKQVIRAEVDLDNLLVSLAKKPSSAN